MLPQARKGKNTIFLYLNTLGSLCKSVYVVETLFLTVDSTTFEQSTSGSEVQRPGIYPLDLLRFKVKLSQLCLAIVLLFMNYPVMLSKTHETEFNRNKSLISGETMSNKFNIFMNKYFMIFNSLLFPEFINFTSVSLKHILPKFWWGQKARFFSQI